MEDVSLLFVLFSEDKFLWSCALSCGYKQYVTTVPFHSLDSVCYFIFQWHSDRAEMEPQPSFHLLSLDD